MSLPQEMNRRAIVVLGMHRSGTSMLARCIHLLGAEVAQQIIPTDTAINRDGFFEDAKIVALNDELLSLLGSCWYDFRSLATEVTNPEGINLWRNQALAHLQEEYAGKSLSVIKDPRMSRLWSYWAPIFKQADLNVDLVHIIRRPEHVAVSLNRRNGMPLAYGLLLWSAHIIDMLRVEDSDESWTTLFYDSFLSEPHKHIKFITAMLGTDLAGKPDYAGIEGQIGKPRSLIPPSTGNEFTLIQDLYDFASQLYQCLASNSVDAKLVVARDEVEQLCSDYEKLLSKCGVELQTLRLLTSEIISLNSELVKIGELHSQAQNVVAERDAQLLELNEDLKRVGTELEYAQSIVAERDAQLVDLNAMQDKQIADLNEQIASRNEQIANRNEQIVRYENVWFRRTWRYIRHPFL